MPLFLGLLSTVFGEHQSLIIIGRDHDFLERLGKERELLEKRPKAAMTRLHKEMANPAKL